MPVLVFTNQKIYNNGMEKAVCVCDEPACAITYGTCHCGCGQPTQISDQTKPGAKYGWPRMFLRGHNRRATWDDSVCVCGFPDCLTPYGLCHCGCGEKTRIAAMTQSVKRWRRDEPMPYLAGHSARGKQYAKKGPNEIRRALIDGVPCVWMLLTKGAWTVLRESDYELVKPYRWYFHKMGYAYTGLPNGKHIGMHTMLISPAPGLIADHKHGDKLDNRRDKLRPATHLQNHSNRGISKRNKSGWSGIDQMKNGMFRVRIFVDGKENHIGVFVEKEKAVEARIAAEKKHYGEFRRTA